MDLTKYIVWVYKVKMSVSLKLFHLFLLVSLTSMSWSQSIRIEEAALKGSVKVVDGNGAYPDWIELYNADSLDILCEGWWISDDPDEPFKYALPSIVVPAKGYLLLYATGKDTVLNGEVHISFKLNAGGEKLVLSNASGEAVSILACPAMEFNQSFGRSGEDQNRTVLFDYPTPFAPNETSTNLIFSKNGGLYPDALEVSVAAENGDRVYYTLNGPAPTVADKVFPKSLKFFPRVDNVLSQIPTTPLSGKEYLSSFIWHAPLEERNTAYVLRCRSFNKGKPSSKVYSMTYIVDPEIDELLDFPILSIIADSTDLFGYDNGIYVPGKVFDSREWVAYWPSGNYHQKRYVKAHVEYFTADGRSSFRTPAMIRTRGGGSVCYPQKSLKLSFKNEIGGVAPEIDFPQTAANRYKSLILRNGGNDFKYTHFSDAFEHSLLSNVGLEVQKSKPAHVYLGGEYWGLFNIREPHDKHFFKRNFDIDEEELIVVNACGSKEMGDNSSYHELISFIEKHPLSDPVHYERVKSEIDILNCIDYYICQIYCGNLDWPGNNYRMWKSTKPWSKWRWLVYDLDLSWAFDSRSSAESNFFRHATKIDGGGWPNPPCSTFLLRSLLESEEFVLQFLKQFRFHLQHTFEPHKVLAVIDSFAEIYRGQMPHQINRWAYPLDMQRWEERVENLRDFARRRPCVIKSQILDFFTGYMFDYVCPQLSTAEDRGFEFSVYPVPARDYVAISGEQEISRIVITNSMGQVLIDLSCPCYQVDISGFENGCYFLTAYSRNDHSRVKIIKN